MIRQTKKPAGKGSIDQGEEFEMRNKLPHSLQSCRSSFPKKEIRTYKSNKSDLKDTRPQVTCILNFFPPKAHFFYLCALF